MTIKLSDFVANFLAANEVTHNFTVPGGGAMHLNDAFAQNPKIECIYVQHEQAASIAAEAYARINNKLPVVCCTTGPGGTNTLTGVVGAWLDSIPMLIISGQVKFSHTIASTELPLRAIGDQEFDIVSTVKSMTKSAEMVIDPKMIKYHLKKALYLATSGRPGPTWIDIPLNIQGAFIEEDELIDFTLEADDTLSIPDATLDHIIEKISGASRPVLYSGNGIRIANAYAEFQEIVNLLKIPVVESFDGLDVIEDANPYYTGRAGLIGDRAGNFAVQNSDVILSVGSRLSIRQVGHDKESWARESYVMMVDIDNAELQKPTIHVEFPIHADAKLFLRKLANKLKATPVPHKNDWVTQCKAWKEKYPVVLPEYKKQKGLVNGYYYMGELTNRLDNGQITVSGNGSSCVISSQTYKIKKDQRYIMNSGCASMGYDLPAAIGASFASNKAPIICLSGDGSIQMNLQELQTIIHHNLPIKIFVINNAGYHSIRQTVTNIFSEHTPYGIGPESGDLSFPNLKKIAKAYGIPYYSVNKNHKVAKFLDSVLNKKGFFIAEIFTTTDQKFEPKSATKKLPDGSLVSPPLEDLAPFLSREELKENMFIPLWKE